MELNNKFSTFNQLLLKLYNSPIQSDYFQPFLDQLVQSFSLCDAILHIESDKPNVIELQSLWISGPTSQVILDEVSQDLLELNYFGQFMLEQPCDQVYGWLLHQGRYPDDYDNYRYKPIHDWFDQNGFIDIAGCIFKFKHYRVFLHLHRQQDVGAFNQQDLESLQAFVPHIKQSLNLYLHFKTAIYSEYDYSILDFVHHPSILFHCNGEVLYANESAKKLITLYEGIVLEDNHLLLESLEKNNQLKAAVVRASLSLPNSDYRSIITINSDTYPITLLVMPVGHNQGARLSGAIVYFYDQESSTVVNFDIISMMFHFTRIEVDICELMLLGISREHIAKELNRSIHTIKDYIKSIYSKVGVNSQADLVSTLLKFPVFPISPQ